MSRMLSFLGAELCTKVYPVLGLDFGVAPSRAALKIMDSYLTRSDIPPEFAARVHRVAATHYLNTEQFRRARQHLRVLSRLNPDCAATQFDLGHAFEADPNGCDRRAAKRYFKAVKLNASEPKYRAALGRALVRINNVKSGVKVLCKAAAAAPADPDVLSVVAEGLREAGQASMAFELLSKARFLSPNSQAIQQLWQRARFDMAREDQRKIAPPESPQFGPRVVPFIRLHGENETRHDVASKPTPHFLRLHNG
jgi:predicted Zn-dependent protease